MLESSTGSWRISWRCDTCHRQGTAIQHNYDGFDVLAERLLEAHRGRAPWCGAHTVSMLLAPRAFLMRLFGAPEIEWVVAVGARGAPAARVELQTRGDRGVQTFPWLRPESSPAQLLGALRAHRAAGAEVSMATYFPPTRVDSRSNA